MSLCGTRLNPAPFSPMSRKLSCVLCLILEITSVHLQYWAPVGTNSDPCLDHALQRWFVPAAQRFSQFGIFSLSVPSSRHLYENLFTQSFTTESFREYCKNYRIGRSEYERCPNSVQKTTSLSGYGLADYICIQRVEDFATALPCLQKAVRGSGPICGPQCSLYEQSSKLYLNPQAGTDQRTFMAGDCRYSKCLADCRRPPAAAACGHQAAALIHDALQYTMASIGMQYGQSLPGAQYGLGGGPYAVPEDCKALAMNAANPFPVAPWNPEPAPAPVVLPPPATFPNPNPVPAGVIPYPTPPYPYYPAYNWEGVSQGYHSSGSALTLSSLVAAVFVLWHVLFLCMC